MMTEALPSVPRDCSLAFIVTALSAYSEEDRRVS